MPSLAPALEGAKGRPAGAVEPGDGVDLELFATIMGPWEKEAQAWVATLWEDARHYMDRLAELEPGVMWQDAFCLWLCRRMWTARPPSVARYAKMVSPALSEYTKVRGPLADWRVAAFLRRMGQMVGIHRAAPRPVLAYAEYSSFINNLSVPQWARAVAVLAMRRASRVMDVAEYRMGHLVRWDPSYLPIGKTWEPPPEGWRALMVSCPFSKSDTTGSWDQVVFSVTEEEYDIVAPWVSDVRHTGHPLDVPQLFPECNARVLGDWLTSALGWRPGAHAFRRSAVRAALDAGAELGEILLLTLHHDELGLKAYVDVPTAATAAVTSRVSRSLTGESRGEAYVARSRSVQVTVR